MDVDTYCIFSCHCGIYVWVHYSFLDFIEACHLTSDGLKSISDSPGSPPVTVAIYSCKNCKYAVPQMGMGYMCIAEVPIHKHLVIVVCNCLPCSDNCHILIFGKIDGHMQNLHWIFHHSINFRVVYMATTKTQSLKEIAAYCRL